MTSSITQNIATASSKVFSPQTSTAATGKGQANAAQISQASQGAVDKKIAKPEVSDERVIQKEKRVEETFDPLRLKKKPGEVESKEEEQIFSPQHAIDIKV